MNDHRPPERGSNNKTRRATFRLKTTTFTAAPFPPHPHYHDPGVTLFRGIA